MIKILKYLSLILIVYLCFYNRLSYSQVRIQSENIYRLNSEDSHSNIITDINIGLKTGYLLLTSPINYESKDWIYGGLAIAATGLSILIDDDIRTNFKNVHSRFFDNVAEIGYRYGDAGYAIAISGTIYLGGKIFNAEEYSNTGRMLLESLLYAGIASTVLKTTIGRSRPYTEEGPYKFRGFQAKTETTSLPSGHTTVAFAMSSVLAERIDNIYASILLYSLAASTVFQRIYDDKHWASDTILGAVIGYTIGKAVVRLDNNQKLNDVSISFYYLTNGAGLNIRYKI